MILLLGNCKGDDLGLLTNWIQRLNITGALEKAFKRKVEGAAQACQEQGISFLPVAVETLGGFHKVAVEQTKRIGAALSRHQGIEENIAIKQLFQRMSLTLMRGNAAMIMSRRPDSDLAQPEVDGIQ